MRSIPFFLLCVCLATALGVGIYTVRVDALKAEALRVDGQQRRNKALEQETARLQTFVESPLCAKATKP